MAGIWVNSSKLSGVSDSEFVCLNYVEASSKKILGSITRHAGENPKWFCQDKSGSESTIQKCKNTVEKIVGQ